mgnify:CR=1 FL=1
MANILSSIANYSLAIERCLIINNHIASSQHSVCWLRILMVLSCSLKKKTESFIVAYESICKYHIWRDIYTHSKTKVIPLCKIFTFFWGYKAVFLDMWTQVLMNKEQKSKKEIPYIGCYYIENSTWAKNGPMMEQ